jgi:hypothetical protein
VQDHGVERKRAKSSNTLLCSKFAWPYGVQGKGFLSEKLPIKSRPVEVSVLIIGSTGAVGRHNIGNNDLGMGNRARAPAVRPAWPKSCCAQEHLTVIAPHYISEHKSDMRGIKAGWYAIEGDGNIFSGPFASREECVERLVQPTDGMMAPVLQRKPN